MLRKPFEATINLCGESQSLAAPPTSRKIMRGTVAANRIVPKRVRIRSTAEPTMVRQPGKTDLLITRQLDRRIAAGNRGAPAVATPRDYARGRQANGSLRY